jgi:hypothetical protein
MAESVTEGEVQEAPRREKSLLLLAFGPARTRLAAHPFLGTLSFSVELSKLILATDVHAE